MPAIVGTNSYVDAAYLAAYATDRGITVSGDADVLLITAMDSLEALEPRYQGERTSVDQPLAWPRTGVYAYGALVPDDVVPEKIKQAQCQYALFIDAGGNPSAPAQAISSRSVGDVSVSYSAAGAGQAPYLATAQSLLRPYYRPAFGRSFVVRS